MLLKVIYLVLLVQCKNQFCFCDSIDFQINANSFIEAFEEAYPTEIIEHTSDDIRVGNEIPAQVPILEEEVPKNKEDQPVKEELEVTETVFQPGSEIKHKVTKDVMSLAENALNMFSNDLKIVNVTELSSTVTNKVQRSLSLVVASKTCEDPSCFVSCVVELTSYNGEDEVIWQNCLNVKSSNEAMRKKRGAIGGFKQVDEKEANELATVAVQTLDSIDADDTKRVVAQVLRAQKQLVNGIMYHLTLEVASSDCKEEDEKCLGKLSDYNICKILMQRLFSGDAPHNAQVIKSECTPISKAKEIDNMKRGRRDVGSDTPESNMIIEHQGPPKKKNDSHNRLMGGMIEQDTHSDKIKELSEFALSEIDKSSNSLNKQKIVRVFDARSQVVAGVKYFLKMELVETNCRKGSNQEVCNPIRDQVLQSCEVVIWEKLWEKFRAVTKVNCSPVEKRIKRALVGGKSPAAIDNPRVQEMAQYAVAQLDASSNSINSQKLVSVKEAQTQVVAGTNYYLKLQVVETNCRKGAENNTNCSPVSSIPRECDVVVYDRPWNKHREMTSSNCHPDTSHRVRRQPKPLVGGKSHIDPNDVNVQKIAQFAVAQLDSKSNSINKQALLKVKAAQAQVVSGVNYYLKIHVGETNCHKGFNTKNVCDIPKDSLMQDCDVVVYDRPWDKYREMTSSNCIPHVNNRRVRREALLVGGKRPVDPKDDNVQKMAQFAVSELDSRSNEINQQKLLVVKKASTQVVAGMNYYLTIQLMKTNCRKGADVNSECSPASDSAIQECDVVVYDRPWDKHREMTSANCSTEQTRQGGKFTAGGSIDQNKTSETIQEMVKFAVEDLNKKSNSAYRQTLVEVISAKSQVVSGVNYHLKLRVAETDCKKNQKSVNSGVCTLKENKSQQECDITVWSRPWLNQRTVTKSDCKQIQADQVVGTMKVLDPLAPEVVDAAKVSLNHIDRHSNSYFKHALIRVVDAKVQTVAGKKYYLTVEVGESECNKNQVEENCPLKQDNSFHDRCSVVVWDRPWLSKKVVLETQCGIRSKREVVGRQYRLKDIHVALFEDFKSKYNKTYADKVEHQKRFRIFRANLKKIQAFQENEQGSAIYGPNMFADLTAKEFKRQYLGLKSGPAPKPSKHHMVAAEIPNIDLPTDFDWRDHNAVTPVKNQGQCGSCWAFSVTGNVEGQWFLNHGELISLSEQELVDCDKTDNGCGGGYMTSAYEAIEKLGGLETEQEYPYDAQDEKCKFNRSMAKVQVASSVNITTNETQIAQWLFANGPISIGINANAMQFYMGGVSHPWKFLCNKDQLDHGVLLVGFGVHRTSIRHKLLPYWLIKNSWGPHWGDKGYYRVYRGDGTCGVNQMASSAIVETAIN